MNFLQQIAEKRKNLNRTTTVLTRCDGKKFLENTTNGEIVEINEKSTGYVIDTKPDIIPACILEQGERKLYLGSQDAVNKDNIDKYSITHILSIGIETPNLENCCRSIDAKFISCLDLPETDIQLVLKTSNEFIKNAFKMNGNVLVHCNAGVSRSSSVIIGFLILEKHFEFDDAYRLVKSKRECIRPNDGFLHQLKAL